MILVGTTLTTFAMRDEGYWGSWLVNAEEIQRNSGYENVTYFAAIETDSRGLEPFAPLLERLHEVLGGMHWSFTLDDGRSEVTTHNRLRHITTGQNLVFERACSGAERGQNITHVLFLAADLAPPPDVLPKLLALRHPVVGGYCPTYGAFSEGPRVGGHYWCSQHDGACGDSIACPFVSWWPYDFPVMDGKASAAFMLFERQAFRKLRWRIDYDEGMTDDPCMHADAERIGWRTFIRKDCMGMHYPPMIPPIEERGHDLRVMRRA